MYESSLKMCLRNKEVDLTVTNITLRNAITSDWDFICAVQELCMRRYAEQTWGHWVAEPQSHFRPDIYQIIQSDGEDIGCIALIEEVDALMLEKFYVLSSHQNRGIGTFLLMRLIDRADDCGKPIRLRVLRVNTAATALYARHGFHIDRSTNERHFMSYAIGADEGSANR